MSNKKPDWIISKLKKDPCYNPFNDKFDYQLVQKEILEVLESNDSIDYVALTTGLSTVFFHPYYVDYYKIFKNLLNENNCKIEELIKYFISLANYSLSNIEDKIFSDISNRESYDFKDYLKYKIQSDIFEPSNAISSIEMPIDLLNIILNYIKYFKHIHIHEDTKFNDEQKVIKNILKIWTLSSLYSNIKDSYDSAIWEDGYIFIDTVNNNIFTKYQNEEYPIILRIGNFRLEQNISAFRITIKSNLDKDAKLREQYFNHLRLFKNHKRLKSISLEGGMIKYQLSKGQDKDSMTEELYLHAEMTAYYSFLENIKLPNLSNLSLNNLLSLFAEIKNLLHKVSEIKHKKSEINNFSYLDQFAYHIKINDLKKYLACKTTFSNKQIESFLNLLEFSDERYDLWKKPFIKDGIYYLFPILSLRNPQIIYLVDEWIKEGGFSLDDRGRFFEDYIINTLKKALNNKKFFFKIPQRKTFSNGKGNHEEIDLILITKNSILIGEIKCIKFPMDSRSRHDAINRLRDGAKQVNRKTDYILANKEDFKDDIGNIENKKIVRVVITNFPIFSGLKLDNVPIIDFFILDCYVNTGKLEVGKVSFNSEQLFQPNNHKTISFYENEDEFSDNLGEFLENPPAIRTLFPMFKIRNYKVTLANANPQIYSQNADTVESIFI